VKSRIGDFLKFLTVLTTALFFISGCAELATTSSVTKEGVRRCCICTCQVRDKEISEEKYVACPVDYECSKFNGTRCFVNREGIRHSGRAEKCQNVISKDCPRY
tara:strand:- start:29155 stop:29466 length:312 start_codon:yes stop_codon:yes gene_type:complete